MTEESIKKHIPELEEMQQIAYWLAYRGWSEANGGNISFRIESTNEVVKDLKPGNPIPLPVDFPGLVGSYFCVTGTGTRMRDISRKLTGHIGIIQLVDPFHFVPLWGNPKPTSELPSHLAIHEVLKQEREEITAIVHTHPTNCVALTHIPEFAEEKVLNESILKMQHETKIFLPDEIAVLSYYIPGSIELGRASAQKLKNHRVLFWDKHGIVAIGKTLSQALDLIEVVEKAADIYWTVIQSGQKPMGLTDEQIELTLKALNIKV